MHKKESQKEKPIFVDFEIHHIVTKEMIKKEKKAKKKK